MSCSSGCNLGGGRWSATICFFDLDDLRFSLDGLWNIDIEGFKASAGSFSNTDFRFDALSLLESDFFATPTDVDPANDAGCCPPVSPHRRPAGSSALPTSCSCWQTSDRVTHNPSVVQM